MIRFLVYLFPLLVNFIAGGTFFISAYRLALAGAGSVMVGLTLAVWAVIYSAASLLVGRITTPGNAPKLIIAGALLIAADALGFLVFDGVYTQFFWLALHGGAFSLYCTPFQVFAKSLEPDGNSGVVRSAALYTASWSVGMAIGPFIFGILPFQLGFAINAALGIGIAAGVYGITGRKRKTPPAPARPEGAPVAMDYSRFPDLVKIGWLVGGVGTLAVTIVRTMVPDRAVLLEFSKADAGLVLAAVSLAQAATAFGMVGSRSWMYKPKPAVVFGLLGVVGLLFFGFGTRLPVFFLGAVVYGVFSGAIYFYLVFHSLVHPTKSARYVAVNEAVVGIANITGPLLGGWAASLTGNSGVPFVGAAIFVAASFGVAVTVFNGVFPWKRKA